MKTAKLIIGIVSIVLTFLVLFQSCAAGIGDAMMNEGGTSGASGFLVAHSHARLCIVAIATRNSRGGAIFCAIVYGLAGLFGISSNGIFKDLMVWGALCLVFAVIFLVFAIKMKKNPKNSDESQH